MANNNHAEEKRKPSIKRRLGSSPARISDPAMQLEARKAFVWLAVIGLAALVVYLSQSLLVIFGALVFASVLDGGARVLGRVLPLPRILRVILVVLAALAFLFWLVMFAGSEITRQAAELPDIIERQARQLIALAQSNGVAIDFAQVSSIASQLASGVGTVTRALGGILGGFATAALIVIIGLYVALDPRLYERGVAWMLPASRRGAFHKTALKMAHTMRRLLAGRLLGMVVEGFFTWFLLDLYGVPMAVLLGLLTGLLAFIPNIGALVSGVLMVTVGFSGGMDMGLYTVFVYFAIQTFDGYVLIPLIAKQTVDLAPAVVLSAQLLLGVLFGLIGLALADPLIAMVKVALERRAEENDEADRRLAQSKSEAELGA